MAFTKGYEEFLQLLVPLLPEDACENQRDAAMILLSGMVGAVMLARTINDSALSERILRVSRDFYTQTFSHDHPYRGFCLNEKGAGGENSTCSLLVA
jgi:TetR/AcrR family transcriptional regulator, transcriptional repressor for nem operon